MVLYSVAKKNLYFPDGHEGRSYFIPWILARLSRIRLLSSEIRGEISRLSKRPSLLAYSKQDLLNQPFT